MDDDSSALMVQVQQGNTGALAQLVRRHQLEAVRAAYGIVLDQDSAEDVVQRAFIALWDYAKSFDPQRPFRPWFLRIVVNQALREVRRHRRLVPLASVAEQADQQHSPEEQLAQRETYATLRQAIGALRPAQRAVIVQKYFLGLSEAEMSDVQGVPAGTIKSRLFTARQSLRQLLTGWMA